MTGLGPAQGAAQRLVQVATSDSAGNATFTFPAAGSGVVITGTLVVPTAPLTAHFVISNGGGTNLGSFDGYNPWGAVQVFPSERLVVTATSLTANTTYQCIWTCFQTDLAHAPVPPTPYGGIMNIANITNLPTPPSSVEFTNKFTLNGSVQQLTASSFPLKFGITLWAAKANAGNVFVGGSNVTTSSAFIEPGVGLTFPIADASEVWVRGTNGDLLSAFGQ